jgi:hypothetical protein
MLLHFILDFSAVWLLATLLTAAFMTWLRHCDWLPAYLRPITAFAITCLAGYFSFWSFFFGVRIGFLFLATIYGTAAWRLLRQRCDWKSIFWDDLDFRAAWLLILLTGCGYAGMVYAYRNDSSIEIMATHRFLPNLPSDNLIPHFFADRLESGTSPRNLFGDWLSSDRPPLQAGIILLLRPPLRVLRLDSWQIAATAGIWFQLLWLPALWACLRAMGARPRAVAAAVTLTVCTGFSLVHSIYAWPKLSAAALVLGGASLIIAPPGESSMKRWALAAVMFALAHLAHGGADFSILAFVIFFAWRQFRPKTRELVAATLIFGLLAAPWLLYQKFYDPPGNRLLKMHLAGVASIDQRGVLKTLCDRYREIGWSGTWHNKYENLKQICSDTFTHLIELTTRQGDIGIRRDKEFFCFFRALDIGIFALLALPVTLWHIWRRGVNDRPLLVKVCAVLAWSLFTLFLWVLLMFGPATTSIHQGSLAPLLLLFAVPLLLVFAYSWRWFVLLAVVQFASFVTTWWPSSPTITGTVNPSAMIIDLICLFGAVWLVLATRDDAPANTPQSRTKAKTPRPVIS